MAKSKKSKGAKAGKESQDKNKLISPAPVEKSQEKAPELPWDGENEFIYHVVDFFKVFGDATRLRMLSLLAKRELCVGDIADRLEMTQSAVSHQLRVLRQNDLVKYRKDGKTVFYSLDDDHVRMVLEQGVTHIRHKKGVSAEE